MTDMPADQSWTLMEPPEGRWPKADQPDDTWEFGLGTGWVYYADGHQGPVKPIILADGFSDNPRRSNLDELWDGLEGQSKQENKFPFISALRNRGYDPIILGYHDRT